MTTALFINCALLSISMGSSHMWPLRMRHCSISFLLANVNLVETNPHRSNMAAGSSCDVLDLKLFCHFTCNCDVIFVRSSKNSCGWRYWNSGYCCSCEVPWCPRWRTAHSFRGCWGRQVPRRESDKEWYPFVSRRKLTFHSGRDIMITTAFRARNKSREGCPFTGTKNHRKDPILGR